MTNATYNKAKEIQEQIAEFEQLRFIVGYPSQRYFLAKTKKLGISTYNGSSVTIIDKGLSELIREYCDKQIKELRDELAAL